jgi:hypothetical protein
MENKVFIRPIGNLMYQLIIFKDDQAFRYKVSKEDTFLVTLTKRENEDWAECWIRYLEAPDERGMGRRCLQQQA